MLCLGICAGSYDVNIERRKARIVIPDMLESTAGPIRSPATGAEHRVRINLDIAEIGSGIIKTMASIALDLKNTCHFTYLRQSSKGVVRSRSKKHGVYRLFRRLATLSLIFPLVCDSTVYSELEIQITRYI